MNLINALCPIRCLAGVLAVLFALPALAIDTQKQLPIEVASDTAEISDQTGIARYTGNVVITQGFSKLEADEVAVTVVEQSVKAIEASGSPARFQEGESDSEPRTIGRAKSIRYRADQQTLVFEGNAELIQTNNSFSGNTIIYDIEKRAIQAQGDSSGGERVKIKYRPADFSGHKQSQETPTQQNKVEPDAATGPTSDNKETAEIPANPTE